VLIVEDNDLVSGALRVLFEQTGRRVSIASTVADAISVASADRPDLMLIDLTLPDGSGLAILEALRRDHREPRLRAPLPDRREDVRLDDPLKRQPLAEGAEEPRLRVLVRRRPHR